jgi:branched-chain amino acid transport system substrate-binding protein
MHLARQNDLLSASQWYGSDGTAQSPVLAADHDAAAFAASVGYPNSLIGLEESARSIWEPLSARIQERTGTAPDTGALAYYDALRVAVLAYLETGPRAPVGRRRRAVVRTANRYFGATGWTKLNAAGDRHAGSYDFWALREQEDGSFAWEVVARFTGGHIER